MYKNGNDNVNVFRMTKKNKCKMVVNINFVTRESWVQKFLNELCESWEW